ncbi:hypothetical protein NKI56_30535 [Mesorhizobium sp. M0622]
MTKPTPTRRGANTDVRATVKRQHLQVQHWLSQAMPSLSRSSLRPQEQLAGYQLASSHELIWEQVRRGSHE